MTDAEASALPPDEPVAENSGPHGPRPAWTSTSVDLDERGPRRWAASEAMAIGWGGITAVAKATGLARSTIQIGITELKSSEVLAPDRQIPVHAEPRHRLSSSPNRVLASNAETRAIKLARSEINQSLVNFYDGLVARANGRVER